MHSATIMAHSYFGKLLIRVIQSCFNLHMLLSMQTLLPLLLVLPSPLLPHMTHSHFIISWYPRRPSPQYLPAFSSLPQSSPSKGKKVEASSAQDFWDHHTQLKS